MIQIDESIYKYFMGLALGLRLVWGLGVVNIYHYGLSLQVVIYGDDLFMCMDD